MFALVFLSSTNFDISRQQFRERKCLKWAFPSSFRLFSSFQTNINFLQQINVKKCPSSILCWDSNPQPLVHESPPLTTRPGLRPCKRKMLPAAWRGTGATITSGLGKAVCVSMNKLFFYFNSNYCVKGLNMKIYEMISCKK